MVGVGVAQRDAGGRVLADGLEQRPIVRHVGPVGRGQALHRVAVRGILRRRIARGRR